MHTQKMNLTKVYALVIQELNIYNYSLFFLLSLALRYLLINNVIKDIIPPQKKANNSSMLSVLPAILKIAKFSCIL